jgi:hypothetical protein
MCDGLLLQIAICDAKCVRTEGTQCLTRRERRCLDERLDKSGGNLQVRETIKLAWHFYPMRPYSKQCWPFEANEGRNVQSHMIRKCSRQVEWRPPLGPGWQLFPNACNGQPTAI